MRDLPHTRLPAPADPSPVHVELGVLPAAPFVGALAVAVLSGLIVHVVVKKLGW